MFDLYCLQYYKAFYPPILPTFDEKISNVLKFPDEFYKELTKSKDLAWPDVLKNLPKTDAQWIPE